MNRKEVKNLVAHYISNQIQNIQNQITDLALDAQNDAKSSAGDKHETGLAMMHLEQEKLNAKLVELLAMQNTIQKLPEEKTVDRVMLGSIVKTSSVIFYVSVAIPVILYDNKQVVCISPAAPLMKVLLNAQNGDEIVFNKISYKIDEIL